MLRHKFNVLRSDGFLRSVGVLVGGTAIGHAILALALPVATRLYTPADFSVLAVFTAVLAILSVASCLRFDLAVPLPEQDSDAVNVLGLAISCALLVATLVAVAVYAVPVQLAGWLNQPGLAPWFWLLPPGIALAGCYSALQFWFIRRQQFAPIASARIGQSCAVAGMQIGLGWLGAAPAGLLVGQVLNSGIASLVLGYRLASRERDLLAALSWSRMRAMFSRYDRFPKFSTLEALSNGAGGHLPIILIGALAAGPEAGYLVLAMYVIQAPMGLIGGAVGQVYMSRAPEEHRAGRLGSFTTTMMGGLLKTGVGPLIATGLVAPDLFAIVFGNDWRRAGLLVSWMIPWFILQFLSFPVSMALHVTGQQKTALALQLTGLFVRVTFVIAADFFFGQYLSEAYAISGLVFYIIYFIVLVGVVSARSTDLLAQLKSALPLILMWCGGGLVMLLVLRAVMPLLPR